MLYLSSADAMGDRQRVSFHKEAHCFCCFFYIFINIQHVLWPLKPFKKNYWSGSGHLNQSVSSNSCGVYKIALPENRLRVYEIIKFPKHLLFIFLVLNAVFILICHVKTVKDDISAKTVPIWSHHTVQTNFNFGWNSKSKIQSGHMICFR